MIQIVFHFFGATAIISALLCITRRNVVASALWLVTTMLSLAGIYVLLNAQFVGAIQVLVYAGAVMVLFLFVIMLLNLDHLASDMRGPGAWLPALAMVTVLAVQLLTLRGYSPERLALEFTRSAQLTDPAAIFPGGQAGIAATASQGVVGAVAAPLFEVYLVPFELTSILLLAAIVGAVVLAKRRI